MNRNLLAVSLLGSAFDWIQSGVELTAETVRDWIVASFNAQVLAIITAAVVVLAVFMRISSSRRL